MPRAPRCTPSSSPSRPGSRAAGSGRGTPKCGWRESNPHGLPRRFLRPVRLPGFATSAGDPAPRGRRAGARLHSCRSASSSRARRSYGSNSLTSASRKRRSALTSVSSLCSELSRPAVESMSNSSSIPVAVGDLQDHPRLEVERAVLAVVRARRATLELPLGRVLDIGVDKRGCVEAGQVEQRALVHASAVRHAHPAPFVIGRLPAAGSGSVGCRSRRRGEGPVQPTPTRRDGGELTAHCCLLSRVWGPRPELPAPGAAVRVDEEAVDGDAVGPLRQRAALERVR